MSLPYPTSPLAATSPLPKADIKTPAPPPFQPSLDLVTSTASSSAVSVVGTVVTLPRACAHCGSIRSVLGSSKGPHWGELRCEKCAAHVGWLTANNSTKL
jgi:hypothetical protein